MGVGAARGPGERLYAQLGLADVQFIERLGPELGKKAAKEWAEWRRTTYDAWISGADVPGPPFFEQMPGLARGRGDTRYELVSE